MRFVKWPSDKPMAELKAYTCDAGCGNAQMMDKASDSVTRYGWFLTFTPDGFPTWYTCSAACLARISNGIANAQKNALRA